MWNTKVRKSSEGDTNTQRYFQGMVWRQTSSMSFSLLKGYICRLTGVTGKRLRHCILEDRGPLHWPTIAIPICSFCKITWFPIAPLSPSSGSCLDRKLQLFENFLWTHQTYDEISPSSPHEHLVKTNIEIHIYKALKKSVVQSPGLSPFFCLSNWLASPSERLVCVGDSSI